MSKPTRVESDSLGPLEVPADAYYGVQTARAVANFPISGERLHIEMVRAVARIKIAAARANAELQEFDSKKADAVVAAAEEVLAGKLDGQFVSHERQRGDREPRLRAPGREARQLLAGPPERPGQHGPVDERRDPHGDAPGRAHARRPRARGAGGAGPGSRREGTRLRPRLEIGPHAPTRRGSHHARAGVLRLPGLRAGVAAVAREEPRG